MQSIGTDEANEGELANQGLPEKTALKRLSLSLSLSLSRAHARNGQQMKYTAATCLANKWIWSLITNFGDRTANTDKKCEYASSRYEEPVNGIVERWFSAVVQVHNNTAKSIQANSSIIKCKCNVMCQFWAWLQQVCSTAASIQYKSTWKASYQWPSVCISKQICLQRHIQTQHYTSHIHYELDKRFLHQSWVKCTDNVTHDEKLTDYRCASQSSTLLHVITKHYPITATYWVAQSIGRVAPAGTWQPTGFPFIKHNGFLGLHATQ